MGDRSVFELVEGWGYLPLEKPHAECLGYNGLLIAIRQKPTREHYDPQKIHLCMRDEYGLASWRTLSYISRLEGDGRVCLGLITLHDRVDKRVYFFTFGGRLEETRREGLTAYTLRSQAPMLELSGRDETVQDQFASEIEELLAEIETKWGADENGFSRQLAQADPLRLYAATLQAVLQHCEETYAMEETYHDLHDALLRERRWLSEKHAWSSEPPSLESLLAPRSGPAQV